MLVAALDLATSTGIALGEPGGAPVCRTESLGDPQHRGAALLRVVSTLIRESAPDEIVIEAPVLAMGATKSADALRVLVGLAEIAKAASIYLRTPAVEIDVRTVRRHFLGFNPKGREAAKRAVLARCRALGWRVRNDNEADAAALLDCRLSQICAAHAVAGAPLFRGA